MDTVNIHAVFCNKLLLLLRLHASTYIIIYSEHLNGCVSEVLFSYCAANDNFSSAYFSSAQVFAYSVIFHYFF